MRKGEGAIERDNDIIAHEKGLERDGHSPREAKHHINTIAVCN